MPVIKSAKKRVKTANKATIRNVKSKRNLKAALKLFAKTSTAKNHASVQSNIDKALKKGVIHKNKAARLKKRAAKTAKPTQKKAKTAKKTKS